MPDLNKALYGQKGQRKQRVNLITMIFLLAGFAIAAWMKVDFQLYLCYAAGATGVNLSFIYGNIKENQAEATVAVATNTPLPSI